MRQACDYVGSLVRRWRIPAASATAFRAAPGVEDPLSVRHERHRHRRVGRRRGATPREAAVDEVEPSVCTGTFRTPAHPQTLAITA
ncbi:hypothetical protein GCM10010102_40510 [Promicromonospora citrea]|uniref:Uncharacterized protein n=1 Tax=Promicromonospora citrea TaxID=43677 RepID=A0A8H9L7M6_9MICO|nr:hypothetical protein GCM10010102_40510 [Promicromonospora citrea]